MINLQADMRNVKNVMGLWSTIVEDFSKPGNLDTLIGLIAETSSQAFNEYMDASAPASPEKFGHMYDWGELGEEAGRLWTVIIAGTSRVKMVTWTYKQSHNEVPVGVNDEDTRRGGHVFNWKAPVIENGIKVRISPINGDWLAIPTSEPGNTGRNVNKAGTMWFTRHTVSPPVDRIAQGSFTQAWITHFNAVAAKLAENAVVTSVDKFLDSYEGVHSRLPAPKLPTRPTYSRAYIESSLGERIGRRKNGQFMNAAERAEQALRIQRIGDNLG